MNFIALVILSLISQSASAFPIFIGVQSVTILPLIMGLVLIFIRNKRLLGYSLFLSLFLFYDFNNSPEFLLEANHESDFQGMRSFNPELLVDEIEERKLKRFPIISHFARDEETLSFSPMSEESHENEIFAQNNNLQYTNKKTSFYFDDVDKSFDYGEFNNKLMTYIVVVDESVSLNSIWVNNNVAEVYFIEDILFDSDIEIDEGNYIISGVEEDDIIYQDRIRYNIKKKLEENGLYKSYVGFNHDVIEERKLYNLIDHFKPYNNLKNGYIRSINTFGMKDVDSLCDGDNIFVSFSEDEVCDSISLPTTVYPESITKTSNEILKLGKPIIFVVKNKIDLFLAISAQDLLVKNNLKVKGAIITVSDYTTLNFITREIIESNYLIFMSFLIILLIPFVPNFFQGLILGYVSYSLLWILNFHDFNGYLFVFLATFILMFGREKTILSRLKSKSDGLLLLRKLNVPVPEYHLAFNDGDCSINDIGKIARSNGHGESSEMSCSGVADSILISEDNLGNIIESIKSSTSRLGGSDDVIVQEFIKGDTYGTCIINSTCNDEFGIYFEESEKHEGVTSGLHCNSYFKSYEELESTESDFLKDLSIISSKISEPAEIEYVISKNKHFFLQIREIKIPKLIYSNNKILKNGFKIDKIHDYSYEDLIRLNKIFPLLNIHIFGQWIFLSNKFYYHFYRLLSFFIPLIVYEYAINKNIKNKEIINILSILSRLTPYGNYHIKDNGLFTKRRLKLSNHIGNIRRRNISYKNRIANPLDFTVSSEKSKYDYRIDSIDDIDENKNNASVVVINQDFEILKYKENIKEILIPKDMPLNSHFCITAKYKGFIIKRLYE